MIRLGEVEIELLAPRADDSPISRFLERRGEGVHHLALETRDISRALAAAGARGLEGLSPEPLPGVNDTLTCFFHPRSTLGVLYEFVEPRRHEPAGAARGGRG
jgi:methylmalonyl-CoA/ethylmalonyl-CoA epimerase